MRRAALAATVALVLAPGASEATSPGHIVFEGMRVVRAGGLVVLDADGSHRTRVADVHSNAGLVAGPGAYAYGRVGGGVHVHVIVTDARGTRDLGLGQPIRFSPDGQTLAIAREDGGLKLVDRGTGALRGSFPETDRVLDWSAGGLLLQHAGTSVVIVQPDGSGERQLADGIDARWSPDGAWIAYSSQPDPNAPQVLHLVRADGSGDLTLGRLGFGGFAWSPQSARIAFATPEAHLLLATVAGATDDTGMLASGGLAWSPDGSQLAFVPNAGPLGAGPLTVISPTTGATRVVTTASAPATWSPDGRTLLLQLEDGLAVVPSSGTSAKPRLLARNTQAGTWLSDGRVIVYLGEEDGEQLATVAPPGRRVTFVRGLQNAREPALSPDGTKLAFAATPDDAHWTIGVAHADGSHPHVLARSDAIAPSPSWSPDGRFIAYAGDAAIYVVPARGGHPRLVTQADLPWTVAWSPDGKRIAFGNTPGDSDDADIVLVDPSGKHRRIVVQGGAGLNWGGVSWSPDSKTLAVGKLTHEGGDPDGSPDLYLVDVKSGRQRELGWEASGSSWSPDGKQIAIDDIANGDTIAIVDVAKPGHEIVLAPGSSPSWSR